MRSYPCLRPFFHLASAFSFFLLLGTLTLSGRVPQQAQEILVPLDAVWRFHDGNMDLGTTWRELDFDDSGWKEGPALLGYDTGGRQGQWPAPGLQTELAENLGAYYFRKEFTYTGSTDRMKLHLDAIIDDGAVYYLNGREIARTSNIPEGEVTFLTQATNYINPWEEQESFEIGGEFLLQGRNVLAVMLMNNSPNSSDICLGARLVLREAVEEPVALYLSWQNDPTTTMTIQWHTEGEVPAPAVEYGSLGEGALSRVDATSHPMFFSDRIVHTVEVTGLDPDSEYRFRLAHLVPGMNSPFYKFRTMPAQADRPIRFAAGGDVMHRAEWMEEVNRHAMRYDPDFIVWGGDLSYSDGRGDRVDREYLFFRTMFETLISDDGRVVPVIMGIGNHEVQGGYFSGQERGRDAYRDTDEFRESIAPYYYNLIAFPGHPGYGVLDFGNYMSLFFLDTDHSGPVEGAQTEWLRQELATRSHMQNIFPVYHVPSYPSVRDVAGATSQRIRQHWHPLFEQAGVRVAFENHDHAYKRTVPILQEKEDPDGIVFIGDGAWGVGERPVREAAATWYLEKSESMRHLILVTIQGETQDFKVISREGNLIDHYIPMKLSGPR
jgi:acid phosphatase type 7